MTTAVGILACVALVLFVFFLAVQARFVMHEAPAMFKGVAERQIGAAKSVLDAVDDRAAKLVAKLEAFVQGERGAFVSVIVEANLDLVSGPGARVLLGQAVTLKHGERSRRIDMPFASGPLRDVRVIVLCDLARVSIAQINAGPMVAIGDSPLVCFEKLPLGHLLSVYVGHREAQA